MGGRDYKRRRERESEGSPTAKYTQVRSDAVVRERGKGDCHKGLAIGFVLLA